jgi:putative spermidine/putrescine transport system ATP-binding protein
MSFGLDVTGVSKSFGQQLVVDNVSLTVPHGQLVCFLGPSGCGKTTLLRMIAGLETPSAGRIVMNGKDVTDIPPHRRNFAMVFQALALFPFLSVEDNIAYSLRLRNVDARTRRARVEELLALIKLPDIGPRPVGELSGGQRQRVAIARALAQEPALFLLDEPLSALDAKLRDHMQVELRQLQQKLKITTILVTHDQREAMTMADTIVIMAGGTVQQIGPPTDVYRNPANRFVASFIGQTNLFEVGVIDRNHVRLGERVIAVETAAAALAADDPAILSIRPESIRIRAGNGDMQNFVPGNVAFVRDIGGSIEARIDCGGQEVIVTSTPSEWDGHGSGDRILLELPPAACRILAS